MRAALWIAADLGREALGTPALRVMAPLLVIAMPAYQGTLDGWIGSDANPVRLWLSGSAIMPAVLLVGLFADVVMPRILTGEMEPLLAAPVSDREIAAAHLLPVAACQAAYLAIGIPVTMAAYRLCAGSWPEHAWREVLHLALGSTAASLLVASMMVRALMSCRTVGSFVLRSFLPLATVALIDAGCWLLRFHGWPGAALALPAAALAGGAAAAWRATGGLRRDRLLGRPSLMSLGGGG